MLKVKKEFLYIVLFCKVKLSKMASIKTNKNQKRKKKPSFFSIQFFMMYNFAFGPVENLNL